MDADHIMATSWSALIGAGGAAQAADALVTPDGRRVTRSELATTRETWAVALAEHGLGPGHRVATLLPNSIDTALCLVSLVDRVNLMPLNPAATVEQLVAHLAQAQVDAVISGPEFAAALAEAMPDSGAIRLVTDGPTGLTGPLCPAPRQYHTPGLVLQTSGSTGLPKRVPLTIAQMARSASNIAAHLGLGPQDCAVHALPMFHIGALVDLLAAPLSAGGRVIVARDLSAQALIEAVDAGGTWLQLVPTALGHLLEALDDATAARLGERLRFIRMVSADLPETLRTDAEARLGVPVIQMYGMTETAGQITSNPLPPELRRPLSVGRAAGAEIAIIDDQGAVVTNGGVGEVCVRGETVMRGYEGEADTPRHGDWLRTGDLGRIDDDGFLFLTGRAKEVINRGGEKVSPLTVERAAIAIPGVTGAVAYALPHPTLGDQVGLTVVAEPGLDEAAILSALETTLAEYERPRRVTFADSLPKLASGKVDRRRIAADALQADERPAPREGLAARVSALWAETLKCSPPHDGSDFFDDGGDSLSATDFLMALEASLGRAVPPNLLFEAPRFAALVERLEQAPEDTDSGPDWLPYLRRRIAGWKGQRVGRHGVIVARNTVARGTKIFMGDHGMRPASNFGPLVATDHPLFLFRSLRDWVKDHHATYPEHAAFYAREIAELLDPGEEVIMVGFCGGGRLTSLVAPLLEEAGHKVRLFVGVDMSFEAPTRFPVLYIGSNDAKHSLSGRFVDPTRAAAERHPGGFDALHWKTDHRGVFSRKMLRRQADTVRAYLSGARLPEVHTPDPVAATARKARQSAQLRGRLPFLVSSERKHRIDMRVTNTSSEPWPATDESGLYLVADFDTWRGRPFRYNVARAALERPVAPGETVHLSLAIRWPVTNRRRPLILKVAMMDDGFGRFGKGPRRFSLKR